MKRVYLVRHGQTNGNSVGYVPNKEEPLNETGLMQAAQLAERVENLSVDKLVVSDFLRAQQPLAPVVEQKKREPEVVPAFGEMFEPTSIHGLKDEDEKVIEHRTNRNANVANAAWRQEDGENFYDLHERINTAREYLEDLETESVLVVSHSFFLQFFVASILLDTKKPTEDLFHIATTLQMSNTGISYLTYDEGKWRVIIHNDHAHFAE